MATLTELNDLINNPTLREQIQPALLIVAMEVVEDPNPPLNQAERLAYAKRVMTDPVREGEYWVRVLLGLNHEATVQQILDVSEPALLNNIRSSWNLFAGGA